MYASDIFAFAACTDHIDGTGIVEESEQTILQLTGSEYALLMSSASVALASSEDAMGFSRSDEIIAPPLTAPETISHLLHVGSIIVFADIQKETLTLDPAAAEACITKNTRGIIAVDIAGIPHDTIAFRGIADRYELNYIADCSQGFGARRHGRATGAAADACILSLNAQKALKCGEGGVLLTNSESLFRDVVRATQHAHRQARVNDAINYFPRQNGRINPIAAAVVLATLPAVLNAIDHQRRRAAKLIAVLNASGMVEPLSTPVESQPTYPCVIAAWRNSPQPTALLSHLQAERTPARLRNLPVRALHLIDGLRDQFPGQIRIPQPLVNTEYCVERCFCLEAAW